MNGKDQGVEPYSGSGREHLQGPRFERLSRLAWLPIPLLAGAIIAFRVAGIRESYPSETLTLVLSFAFYTLVSLGTLFLIGRSFLASGTPGLLLMECGVILWSLAGTVGDAVSRGNANVDVTIFNTGILLAGVCHLTGAIFSLRSGRALRSRPLWLVAGFALALGALWLVTHATLANRLPVFFIPGQGGTPVRYFTLATAIAMFALSAGLWLANHRRTGSLFIFWYALALLLLAVGLFGVMIQLSLGSVVNWLGRTAQWLGGFYLLLAAASALRESDLPFLSPEKTSRPGRYRYGVAIAIVLAAAALRLVFLPALGTRAAFLTFYPAVMLAALYGGLGAGLLATFLSAVIADYFWIEPVRFLAIESPADWLSVVIFLSSGVMIAWVSETMHRARARAADAESQALLAAEREASAVVLQESEERYHTLFTAMTEGFAVHELLLDESGKPVDYRFLEVNPAFERLTGLKRRDVVGRTRTEVLPGDDPKWLQAYGRVVLTGQPVQFENYDPVRGRHYEVSAYRTAPMQFAVILMDVTERKQAEEKIREARAAAVNLMEDAVEARRQTEEANEKLQQEIVERKRAEQELQKRERLLQGVLDGSPSPIFLKDLDGRFITINASLERMLGISRETIRGKTDHDIAPKEIADYWRAHDKEVMETGKAIQIEEAADLPDGHHIFLANKFPLVDNDGQTYGVGAISHDITDRKQMEEELRRSHDELELRVQERTEAIRRQADLIELSHEAIMVRDLESRILFWSRGAEETYGWTKEEAMGKVTHSFLRTRWPVSFDEHMAALTREGRWEGELVHTGKDGSELTVLSRQVLRRDEAGAPIDILEINIDITERKLAEEALRIASAYHRSLLEASLDPLVTINPEGKISDANAAAERATGYSREEMIGTDFSDYFTDPEKAKSGYLQVFRDGLVQDYGLAVRHRDGHVTPVLYNASVYKDESGNIAGVFAAARDITERKRAEEETNRYSAQLEASNRELQDFAFVASHDLQEPLRKIRAFGDQLKTDCSAALGPEGTDYLERMQNAASRMQGLIQALLNYSRVTTKARPFSRTDLGASAREAAGNLEASILDTAGRVEIEELASIDADPIQMVQLFQNLIGNALKFHGEERPIIKVYGRSAEPDTGKARSRDRSYDIFVEDNGIGFDEKYLDRIFTPFQRLHGRGVYEGTGIGLAICRKIVDRHGGTITAKSVPGKGTTFIVRLPMKQSKGGLE